MLITTPLSISREFCNLASEVYVRCNRGRPFIRRVFRVAVDKEGQFAANGIGENNAMSRATVMERSEIVSLLNRLSCLNRDLASGHLGHANGDEAHQADGIVGVNENEGASGSLADVRLGQVGCPRVQCSFGRNGVVCACDFDNLQYPTAHGCVPAMIAFGAEEGLDDCRTATLRPLVPVLDKVFGIVRVVIQEVKEGVWLGLDPELIRRLGIAINALHIGFATGNDDV